MDNTNWSPDGNIVDEWKLKILLQSNFFCRMHADLIKSLKFSGLWLEAAETEWNFVSGRSALAEAPVKWRRFEHIHFLIYAKILTKNILVWKKNLLYIFCFPRCCKLKSFIIHSHSLTPHWLTAAWQPEGAPGGKKKSSHRHGYRDRGQRRQH